MAETNCTHGFDCLHCEMRRIGDITAHAVTSIRIAIGNDAVTGDEPWNYGDDPVGARIATHVFDAVKEAAKFPDLTMKVPTLY